MNTLEKLAYEVESNGTLTINTFWDKSKKVTMAKSFVSEGVDLDLLEEIIDHLYLISTSGDEDEIELSKQFISLHTDGKEAKKGKSESWPLLEAIEDFEAKRQAQAKIRALEELVQGHQFFYNKVMSRKATEAWRKIDRAKGFNIHKDVDVFSHKAENGWWLTLEFHRKASSGISSFKNDPFKVRASIKAEAPDYESMADYIVNVDKVNTIMSVKRKRIS